MDVYAVTLALALAVSVAALALAICCWLASVGLIRSLPQFRTRRIASFAGVAALGLVFLSTASHVVVGHRPGSPSMLAPAAFIREHPALVVTSALAAGALWLLWIARPAADTPDTSRLGR